VELAKNNDKLQFCVTSLSPQTIQGLLAIDSVPSSPSLLSPSVFVLKRKSYKGKQKNTRRKGEKKQQQLPLNA
jgi:hypothetical protein